MTWWEWLIAILFTGFYIVILAVIIKYGRIGNEPIR